MGGDFTGHPYATRSQGPPIYSEMADPFTPPTHRCYNKPGGLAPAWIDRMCNRPGYDLLACDSGVSHTLRMVPTQSRPDDMGLLVCICETCKKTFTFQIAATNGRCPSRVDRKHHLVTESEERQPGHNILYPVISKTTYVCSATDCSLTIHLDVCKRRLPREWDTQLLDRGTVTERLKALVKIDPRRFEELTHPDKEMRLVPAFYLQAYIRDALKPRNPLEDGPRVSVRNKFYAAIFEDQFEDMLRYMGFEEVTIGEDQYVQLPSVDSPPASPGPTPYSSRRAWLEIIRAHLYCLLLHEHQTLVDLLQRPPDGIDLPSAAATKTWLTKLLDAKYSPTTVPNWANYPQDAMDVLGALKDFPEPLLWYAATSQNQTNPQGRKAVYEALYKVASDRLDRCDMLREFLNDESLHISTEMSKEDSIKDSLPKTPLSKAYSVLDVSETCSDDELRNKLHRMSDTWTQAMERTARHSLRVIAEARNSETLMQTALTFPRPEIAAQFLGVETSTSPEFAVSQIIADEQEAWFDKIVVAAAARELAGAHFGHSEVGALLSYASTLESDAGNSSSAGPSSGTETRVVNLDLSLPVGLQNIRNTCYLNSILQYFNTVVPVRNVILNWESYKLEPTEENISSRRLGGPGSVLTKGEAYLAARFIEEMRSLFLEIQSATTSHIRPKQRLALAALKNADQLVRSHAKKEAKDKAPPFIGPQLPPPELPPRPSSKPPVDAPLEPTVSVNPVVDSTDTGSDVSSVTLVGQRDGEDNTYVELSGPIPPAVPAKKRSTLEDDDKEMAEETEPASRGRSATRGGDADVEMTDADGNVVATPVEATLAFEEKIEAALNDKAVTGTDQQDIEEVMGTMMEHFHAAVKPTRTDETTGQQTDIFTETFFWSHNTHIQQIDLKTGNYSDEPRSVSSSSRWMTAFPSAKGKIDLYSALDNTFDRELQELDGGKAEIYLSITKAPPILHIYIQRSQNISGQLNRNNNIVEIPDRFYLDRFMDADDDSDIIKKRQRSWNLKGRLRTLNNPWEAVSTTTLTDEKGKGVQEADYEMIDQHLDEFGDAIMSMDTGEGDGQDEYVSILDAETRKMMDEAQLLPFSRSENTGVSTSTSQEAALVNLDFTASKRAHAKVEQEKVKVQEELSALFSDMKTVSYRLHAVICHGGGFGSGHYWVWIYDFQKNVWRQYNDETVTESRDSARVLADLNTSSTPYYLAYVRENMCDELAVITERTAPTQTADNSSHQSSTGLGQAGTGAPERHPLPRGPSGEHIEIDGEVEVLHVEDRND